MVTVDDIKILREFLGEKGIDFVLTGTAALDIHGLLPEGYEPGDIDIIVIVSDTTKDYIGKELKAIEYLTGGLPTNYPDRAFTFYVGPNKTKVNAIPYFVESSSELNYIELTFGKKTLKLHAVNEILKAKFRLQRMKDYKFYCSLIETINNYV